ncbi:MAG: benzoate-CoA ligase family protein [Ectothiorhodospiraceae bacterium]|nr:benzoate-CoA ligase family protein [Ectothiorhodospiraceae bacterium]
MSTAARPVPHPDGTLDIPRDYNAASDFIDQHLTGDRRDHLAVIDDHGRYTYRELAERMNRAGNALRQLGLRQESRVVMIMLDSVDFPAVFWGAIKAGIVPIPVNTLLTADTYRHILNDSRAEAVIVSAPLYESVAPALSGQAHLRHVIVAGGGSTGDPELADLLAAASTDLEPARTTRDDCAFWLYSSGSTGAPKGTRHLHRNLRATAELYAKPVLGIRSDDIIFSAAKLFFAYGLGNGMSFPFSVGATAVYMAERPTPDAVLRVMREHQPTIYCGVPTLYAAILADRKANRDNASQALRICISAGEALPEEVGRQWQERFGAEVLDGVGSTEMLHIFLSNQPGAVRYGTSGFPVPGYEARLVDETGKDVPDGEVGELLIKGPSAAESYWNNREKSLGTFVGPWTYTGDKYYRDDQGYYHYCGRADDMMKVSGNWVSPFEVESALIEHPSVLEAAVIAREDAHGMIKPAAYVVLREDARETDDLEDSLKQHVKQKLAPWKYPRWIEFIDELPKTATGKIQRFKLRQRATETDG